MIHFITFYKQSGDKFYVILYIFVDLEILKKKSHKMHMFLERIKHLSDCAPYESTLNVMPRLH